MWTAFWFFLTRAVNWHGHMSSLTCFYGSTNMWLNPLVPTALSKMGPLRLIMLCWLCIHAHCCLVLIYLQNTGSLPWFLQCTFIIGWYILWHGRHCLRYTLGQNQISHVLNLLELGYAWNVQVPVVNQAWPSRLKRNILGYTATEQNIIFRSGFWCG